jgi:ribbon-helix-helix CopG family protein
VSSLNPGFAGGKVEGVRKISDDGPDGASPKAYTRLPVDVLEKLDERARDLGTTRAAVIRRAVVREVSRRVAS